MILYRPVGFKELELIYDCSFSSFPPRLDWQPIFYPVTNEEYASEIARKWNYKDQNSQYIGFITKFEIDDNYIKHFEKHIVGSSIHEEYWIPSEELSEFNKWITSKITVEKCYLGKLYEGFVPRIGNLKNKSISDQVKTVMELIEYSTFDLSFDISFNMKAVYFNWPLWVNINLLDLLQGNIDIQKLIETVNDIWETKELTPSLIQKCVLIEDA